MIQTQLLYDTVRRELKDVQSPTVIGQFWDDIQLNIALNAAVNMLVNIWLFQKNTDTLSVLYSNISYSNLSIPPTKEQLYDFDQLFQLPEDYLHYVSATVGDEFKTAKLYIGAEVDDYYNVRHNAVFIRKNGIRFSLDGNMESGGMLHYYRQPSIVPLNGNDLFFEDFAIEIYTSIICKQAALLLAYKETPTQREYKNLKENVNTLSALPKLFVNYVNDRDAIMISTKGNKDDAKGK